MTSSPFDPHAELILLTARIRGPQKTSIALLALDTGATQTVLTWNVLRHVGYDPAAVPDRVRMTTASGIEYVPEVVVQSLTAIGREKEHFTVLCHSLPPTTTLDGVLGLDFLRGQQLTLDFRSGIVILE